MTGGQPPSDPGSDDDDDDDPEPHPNTPARDWRNWGRRQARYPQMMQEVVIRQDRPRAPDHAPPAKEQAPEVDKFDGTPEKLDTFLRQLKIKFSLEPRRFQADLTRIYYCDTGVVS